MHASPVVFEILRSNGIGVTSLTFRGHVTSSVTWIFDSLYRPFAIGGPLERSLYLWQFPRYWMANVTQWLTWYDLKRPLNKGQGHSFNWFDSSYATSYRLSIVTFALGRTV